MMKLITISAGYIDSFWAPICEGRIIPNEFIGLNLNNYESAQKLIEEYLIPKAMKFKSKSWHYSFKETLRYAINFWSNERLYNIYMGVLPEIPPPQSKYIKMKDFYLLIWTVMYPNEECVVYTPELYKEVPSVEIGSF
ncbi:hypothetical protein [Proteus mirabilis]|uniref:hypothetical protein n=1 Tax=Proteus mirabilis TaxID=584 RepID=UPI00217E9564|nr:hypothetical protein [Proteus mirabilis]MCS6726711.1 hypothetical protein [Proteus mirabilis]